MTPRITPKDLSPKSLDQKKPGKKRSVCSTQVTVLSRSNKKKELALAINLITRKSTPSMLNEGRPFNPNKVAVNDMMDENFSKLTLSQFIP